YEFGPLLLPAMGKQILASYLSVCLLLDQNGQLDVLERTFPLRNLREIRARDVEPRSKPCGIAPRLGEIGFEVHAPSLEDTNSTVKQPLIKYLLNYANGHSGYPPAESHRLA